MFRKILFAVIAMVLGSVTIANSAILLDKVMAIVNKEVITWSDLYKGMEFEATDEVKAMKSEDRRKLFKENEMVFLENMIDTRLQLQEAWRIGISAGDEDVNRAITSIKTKYSMTDEMFKEAIGREGFTMPAYRKKLVEQITVTRVIEQEVKGNVLVTEVEIDNYLSKHKGLAKENEGFNISHILLKRTTDRKQLEEKASDIYKRIKAGESFQELAGRYSEDANAKSGGDMGFVRKSDLSRDFLEVLLKMKSGDVSEPFWNEKGIHILRVNEILMFKTTDEMREAVKQKLLNEKFSAEYRNWLKGLRERAYIEIKL